MVPSLRCSDLALLRGSKATATQTGCECEGPAGFRRELFTRMGGGWIQSPRSVCGGSSRAPGSNHPLDERARTLPFVCSHFHLTCLFFHFHFSSSCIYGNDFVILKPKLWYIWKTLASVRLFQHLWALLSGETPFGLVRLGHGRSLWTAPPPSFCSGRRSWRFLLIPASPLVPVVGAHHQPAEAIDQQYIGLLHWGA